MEIISMDEMAKFKKMDLRRKQKGFENDKGPLFDNISYGTK